MRDHRPQSLYKGSIASYLDCSPDNISLFWKGRVAFYGILKSLGIGPGDEVIIPGFTCVVVPNAIIYLGATPVYADIDPLTYTIDPESVEKKITKRTKIILAQNTFGLSADMDALMEIAGRRGVQIVEDCTHGIGGFYKGRKNGTLAKASFFSTQWNKPFSTGLGGFAKVDDQLSDSMLEFEKSCIAPSLKDVQMLRALLAVRKKTSGSPLYWTLLHWYRRLSKVRGFAGSSSGEEISGTDFPQSYLKGISEIQCLAGLEALNQLDENVSHQREIAAQYSICLSTFSVPAPVEPKESVHSFLKYPLLVDQRQLFLEKAEKNKIEISDWFLSPLHPVLGNLEKWNYLPGTCPVAERISALMVNLPTHRAIDSEYVQRVKIFLTRHEHLLVRP